MPENISLPKDTGPHKNANIEWWYFFAYLHSDRGTRYAVMGSFFRVGELDFSKGHYLIYTLIDLDQKTRQNYSIIDSKLKANMLAIYLPFYLLLHPTDKRIWHLYKELLTGNIPPPHTKMEKASIKKDPVKLIYGENTLSFDDDGESFDIHVTNKDSTIDLQFEPRKPISLIGEDGKPDDLYYYSFTQNNVKGEIRTERGEEIVAGKGWFDHQWGRDYGLIGDSGWNWFGLQLDDGRELLLNNMYSSDSSETSSPMANMITTTGTLDFTRDVQFEELKHWKSLRTNAKYPIEWKITIPTFSMELHVKAVFPKQEMPIIGPLQAIWEGACNVTGNETLSGGRSKKLNGKGFMELVGYA